MFRVRGSMFVLEFIPLNNAQVFGLFLGKVDEYPKLCE
jgi:hypothetical protein